MAGKPDKNTFPWLNNIRDKEFATQIPI